jgi:Phage tail tube protein FII
MSVNAVPEKVVNFNVYAEGDRLVGVSAEIKLPSFEAITETITGAGIAGELESATPGHFKSMQIEIPFRILYDPTFSLAIPNGQTITLRASQQSFDLAAGKIEYRPLKITLKTMPKNLDLGTLGIGKPTESNNVLEILYIKIQENGVTVLEYDKLNFIYVVNGVDVLGIVKNQI